MADKVLFIVIISPVSHPTSFTHLPSPFPQEKNPHHSPTLSCRNEQFLFLRFDAMLTGVTLIYLGV